MMKSGTAFAMALFLSGACWAQSAPNPAIKAVMGDIDAMAPGVKPDKAVSLKLQGAINTLGAQLDSGRLGPDDLVYARLYHAKALYFLVVNQSHFTDLDYDREDVRAIRYEFEQAINLMLDQSDNSRKDWKNEMAEANWQAGSMAVTTAVDEFTAYDSFFPACAALGRPECKKMMAQAPKK